MRRFGQPPSWLQRNRPRARPWEWLLVALLLAYLWTLLSACTTKTASQAPMYQPSVQSVNAARARQVQESS
jgi:hypothetical protein